MTDLQLVPHARIQPSPLNPRGAIDDDRLAELAASIRSEGLLQNLVVRPRADDAFEIAAGERRWQAIRTLIEAGDLPEDHAVPVVVRDLTDLELLTLATTENMARADMHPVDEARAFARMLALGSDVETIALETGLSEGTVKKRLALVERLGEPAIEALQAGEITLGQAQALTLAGPVQQERMVRELTNAYGRSWTPAELRGAIKRQAIPASRARFDLAEYTGSLTQPSVFDEDGEATFDDVEQFHELQAAAVERLRAEYAKRWAWCEVTDYHRPWTYDQHEDDEDHDPAKLGVIIEYSASSGEVTIHERLEKRETQRLGGTSTGTGAGSAAAEKDPLALTKKHGEILDEHRTRALQSAVTSDESGRVAMALACMGMMRAYHWSVLDVRSHNQLPLEAVSQDVRETLNRFAREHPALEAFLADGGGVVFSREREAAAMRALLDLDDLPILFAALVARNVRIGGGYDPFERVDAAAAEAAAHVGVQLPTYRQLGPGYLKLYSKPRLQQVAEALCGDHARAWEGLTRAQIATNIFDTYGSDLDTVPPELRMDAEAASGV